MRDSFMVPEIEQTQYYAIETDNGTSFIPVSVVGHVATQGECQDYCNGLVSDPDAPAEVKTGWIYRLQAPGYMDATEWSAAQSEAEALTDLLETYGSDDPDHMERWELDAELRRLELSGLGRFEVREWSSGYELRDRTTDQTHWLSDGVDVFTSDDPSNPVPDVGTEEFRKLWEDSLNANADETLEAYFPERYEFETNDD